MRVVGFKALVENALVVGAWLTWALFYTAPFRSPSNNNPVVKPSTAGMDSLMPVSG